VITRCASRRRFRERRWSVEPLPSVAGVVLGRGVVGVGVTLVVVEWVLVAMRQPGVAGRIFRCSVETLSATASLGTRSGA
jgi:hypothetical protein